MTTECEVRMVADHLSFLHSECKQIVTCDRRQDMRNMYKLLKPIDSGLSVMVQEIQAHVTRIGLQAINLTGENLNNPQLFVENMLDVHRQQMMLIRDVFTGDQLFVGALDKACSSVINHRKNSKTPCKSPELLARYCDALLKKSVRGLSESEIDDKLGQSITVFKYIDDKDVFQKFYAKMLAKRLIHSQSVSMDSEESMINKLKQACGYEFTSKLHRMFTDIKLSEDLNQQFNVWCRTNSVELGISFGILVLQAGAWPLQQTAISPFSIPQPFEKSVSNFETSYNSKFNGRKLTWLHHLSTVELKVGFTKKVYTVSMGTYHMAILWLFESTNTLTYKDLSDATKLTDEQLIKHLQSLIDAKLLLATHESLPLPVIVKPELTSEAAITETGDGIVAIGGTPAAAAKTTPQIISMSTVPPDLLLTLNLSYQNKRTKFKITAVVQKEAQQVINVSITMLVLPSH